jgi:hypothetical protein
MAALASIATIASIAGAGLSGAAAIRQSRAQSETQRAQVQIAQRQEQSRQQELIVQRERERAERGQTLARTVAATRARLAAGGVAPDEGSAEALATGLHRTAAEAEGQDDEAFRARLSRGRASLLAPDGSVNAFLSAGRTLGQATRSLLG